MFESENEIVQQLIEEFDAENVEACYDKAHARLELESCLSMDDGNIELHSANMGEIEKYIFWLKEQIPEQPAEV